MSEVLIGNEKLLCHSALGGAPWGQPGVHRAGVATLWIAGTAPVPSQSSCLWKGMRL